MLHIVQVPASLDFVFVTDHGRHLLHYLVSGISESDEQLDRLYSREDVTCRSTHHVQRANLLRWLFARNLLSADMDWNAADSGCVRSAMRWCLRITAGSHCVPAAHLPISQSIRSVCEGAVNLAATSSHTA